jgi:hypothetical protein
MCVVPLPVTSGSTPIQTSGHHVLVLADMLDSRTCVMMEWFGRVTRSAATMGVPMYAVRRHIVSRLSSVEPQYRAVEISHGMTIGAPTPWPRRSAVSKKGLCARVGDLEVPVMHSTKF